MANQNPVRKTKGKYLNITREKQDTKLYVDVTCTFMIASMLRKKERKRERERKGQN